MPTNLAPLGPVHQHCEPASQQSGQCALVRQHQEIVLGLLAQPERPRGQHDAFERLHRRQLQHDAVQRLPGGGVDAELDAAQGLRVQVPRAAEEAEARRRLDLRLQDGEAVQVVHVGEVNGVESAHHAHRLRVDLLVGEDEGPEGRAAVRVFERSSEALVPASCGQKVVVAVRAVVGVRCEAQVDVCAHVLDLLGLGEGEGELEDLGAKFGRESE